VDVAYDLSVNANEEALTWRYVAMQVLEGLCRLRHPAAEVANPKPQSPKPEVANPKPQSPKP
jgi:hypothetical protein